MPPKRPADNNKESEEKRQWVDERLKMEKNLQTTADPALTISPALIETLVSRVEDEVTRPLQPRNTEPFPGPSSEEQPPCHKPAQEVADPQEKTNSLVEQAVFSVSQSLAGLYQGDSSTSPVYQLTVRFKCEPRYGQMNLLILGSSFHTRFLKTSLKLRFKQLIVVVHLLYV